MATALEPCRKGVSGAGIAAVLLFILLAAAPLSLRPYGIGRGAAAHGVEAADHSSRRGSAVYEERAAAERHARSRFRRLEVASLVLILLAGGAAILWAIRRK